MTPALYEALACTCEFDRVDDDDRFPRIVRFVDPTCLVHIWERM